MLKNLRIGVIIINRSTHIIEYANEDAAFMSDSDPEEMIGKKCLGYICTAEEGNCPIEMDGPVTRTEYPYIKSDGSILKIIKTARPMIYNHKPCLIMTFFDSTEIDSFNATLVESNKQLSLIKEAVNNSSDAVAISSIGGDFFFTNNAFSALFRYSIDSDSESPGEKLFTDPLIFRICLDLAHKGDPFKGEVEMHSGKGNRIPIFLRSAPFRDENGLLTGIIWNFTDITVRKRNEQWIQEDLIQKREMLRKAHLLQQSYIQKEIPAVRNINIQGLFMPCEKLGGDFFRITRGILDDKLIIIMGDCTDHGLKSSLDASLLSSVIENHLEDLFRDDRTDLFLNKVSREFMGMAEEDQFPTMTAMIIDLSKGLLHYSNANGELPYVFRQGKLNRVEKAAGMHLTYYDDPLYEKKEMQLQNGDRLIIYSDAVVEIPGCGGREKNRRLFEELLRSCNGNSSKCFYEMVRQLEMLNGGFPLDDDTTLIQMEYVEEENYSFSFHHIDEWNEELIRFKEMLRRFDYGIDEREKTAIAVTELAINAFCHGNMTDITKTVNIRGTLNCRRIELTIEDEGSGFDPGRVPDPVKNIQGIVDRDIFEEYTHGRGLRIADDFLSELTWNRKGNCVTLIQERKSREIITIEKIRF